MSDEMTNQDDGFVEVAPLYWEKDNGDGNVSFIDNRNNSVSQGCYNKTALRLMTEHIAEQLSFTKATRTKENDYELR
jgi:hypothetical protein